jgi:hypothetical protein
MLAVLWHKDQCASPALLQRTDIPNDAPNEEGISVLFELLDIDGV